MKEEASIPDLVIEELAGQELLRAGQLVSSVSQKGGSSEGYVRKVLSHMLKDGRIHQPKRGYYQLPQSGDGAKEMRFPEAGDAELSEMIGDAISKLPDAQGPAHLRLLSRLDEIRESMGTPTEEQLAILIATRDDILRSIQLIEQLRGRLAEARR